MEFRRRTSSVPPRYDEMKKLRNLESRVRGRGSPPRSEKMNQRQSPGLNQNEVLSPNAADGMSAYQRMRTFTIDPAKGAVINRGDSFRRRCNTGVEAASPQPVRGHRKLPEVPPQCCHSPAALGSKNSSTLSSRSHSPMPFGLSTRFSPTDPPSPTCPYGEPVRRYSIVVLGLEGVGKTSMINQFMTSEYCNPFQAEAGKRMMI